MLSYRHSFHAGNFADVLKHLVLVKILGYLRKKDKPFCCIDTHAGPGKYDLGSSYALQNKEFDSGIGKIWQRKDLPEAVASYVDIIKAYNTDGELNHYPGSPLIARQLLRNHDRLFLFELHSAEVKLLTDETKKNRRIKVFHADGLADSLGLLPPVERRGLVLIDPSYEIKTDYDQVVDTLIQMHKRFATGIYALWYPVVDRSRNKRLEKAIQNSGIKNIQLFELGVQADTEALGMTSSGIIVVNPPWNLATDIQQVLPWLVDVLGREGKGFFRSEMLVAE